MSVRWEDLAVVLDTVPFSDRHLVVAVLTREHGAVRGVLRGARGGRAPKTAATQVLSRVRLSAYRSQQAELATFDGFELERSSFALAADLDRAGAGAAVAEALLAYCPLDEPSPRHFRLADAAAGALLGGADPAVVLAYVQHWVLALGGVLPSLAACASCGAPLDEGFRPRAADEEPSCRACAAAGGAWLGRADLAFLVACRTAAPGEVAGPAPPGAAAWLERLVRHHAERRLPALDLYKQLRSTER